MNGAYKLDGKTVVPTEDIAGAFDRNQNHRQLGFNILPNGVRVSTVFLVIEHGFEGDKPIIFETMIFDGPHDEYQERYTDYDAALAGHERALKLARGEA